jgi:hypothetical protein
MSKRGKLIDGHFDDISNKVYNIKKYNDPDLTIIKAHLVCEYYIDQFIILKKNDEDDIHLSDMTFNYKITKFLDQNDSEEKKVFRKLNRLNKLRNSISHELDYSIRESDVDSIGVMIGREYIFKKYKSQNNLSELLFFVLENVISSISFLVYCNLEKTKVKK